MIEKVVTYSLADEISEGAGVATASECGGRG